MTEQTLSLINRAMDEQLKRKAYPEGFPPLPDIPTARYFDAKFAEAEQERLWRRTWLLAGVESELSKSGAYVLFEQLGLSIIILRGQDGAIRAFHNVCRHRASTLLSQPKGDVSRSIVCPYHAWSYSLDGRLLSVPEAHDFACLDKSRRGLAPVRCETWRGLVFINLDDAAGGLADFMAPVGQQTAGFPLETVTVHDHFFVEMECNWKLAYHNFLEAYHVLMVHPQSLGQVLNPRSLVISLLQNGHARNAVNKPKADSIYSAEVICPEPVDELFSRFTVSMINFPNTFFALDASGFAFQTFWPAGVNRSILEVRLVGWEGASADAAYWSQMRTTIESILAEDLRLFAGIQRGVASGATPRMLAGYQERAIYWFEEELDRTIGADAIPDGMEVAQVLSGQVGRYATS